MIPTVHHPLLRGVGRAENDPCSATAPPPALRRNTDYRPIGNKTTNRSTNAASSSASRVVVHPCCTRPRVLFLLLFRRACGTAENNTLSLLASRSLALARCPSRSQSSKALTEERKVPFRSLQRLLLEDRPSTTTIEQSRATEGDRHRVPRSPCRARFPSRETVKTCESSG